LSIERAWEPDRPPDTKQVEMYEQPAFYGLGKYAPPKKAAKKPAADKVVARTADGQQPFDLVNGWALWMNEQTGVQPHKTMLVRLMAEVKELILTGYTASDIKWSLAIWSTKLADNLNTSPRELADVAWKYRMDQTQAANAWRQRMKQSATQMGKQGVSPSALSNGNAAQAKSTATLSAAQSWADRKRQKEQGS
jgi:hypothetical protein